MTLLLPAADRVVREAVDAVLDGRSRPGAGADISFATRSSRYRLIHGVLREATDSSLVGARFIGWLFDGTREPKVSERWDTDARAVLLDESKGQIIVSSLTRVHVENALPPEALELPSTQLDGGFPQRAGTLHGMAAIDPLPDAAGAAPAPAAGTPAAGDAPLAEPPPQADRPLVPSSPPEAAGPPAQAAPPAIAQPAAPPPQNLAQPGSSLGQPGSPLPKRTIPPAPPIPGRQATPVPLGSPVPARLPTPPHPGNRTAPMAAMAPPPPPTIPQIPAAPAPAMPQGAPSPSRQGPPGPPPRMSTPRTYFGLGPATQAPPPMAAASAPSGTAGEASAPTDAPLPQFDLDDMDIPTRTDPLPPAPPSQEGEVAIPLIPRSDG